MGCGGSKEVEVVAPPAGPSDEELRARATKAPLPKAHGELTSLINLLAAEDDAKVQAWLKLLDETRLHRKKVEEESGMEFAQFREWVAHVEACLSKGILTVAALEDAWQVATDATLAKRKIVVDAAKLPLPPDDKELAELIAVLLERDRAKMQTLLKLIDETRLRRKAIQAASQVAFADLRCQVAIMEVGLSKGVLLGEHLHKAWQPLPETPPRLQPL